MLTHIQTYVRMYILLHLHLLQTKNFAELNSSYRIIISEKKNNDFCWFFTFGFSEKRFGEKKRTVRQINYKLKLTRKINEITRETEKTKRNSFSLS